MHEPTVEKINEILRGSYAEEGIPHWWNRPRGQLDGRTPAEAWDTDRQRVAELAEWLNGPGDAT